MTFHGLTWDHPRGFDALDAAARAANTGRTAPLILWDKQPLEGFESAPITELTAQYDLVVLDHPHIGEAVLAGCLQPLEALFEPDQIAQWAGQTVGPAFRSYQWEGRHWALPLDAATQVMARRPDRIAKPPQDWAEVEEIAQSQPVALSLAGPHAFLSLISMAAGAGAPIGGAAMLPDAVALDALARLSRLAAQAPPGSANRNPIALLEAMARGAEIALIPLVFGYVTYAQPGSDTHRIAFSDSIRGETGFGGVLGGTGIAVSARCDPTPQLLDHVADLLSLPMQTDFFPRHGGQPSARAAWQSAKVNQDWGGFYAATYATAEKALLRPRFDGFPAFTNAASARLRAGFAAQEAPETLLHALRAGWAKARARARGSLDDGGPLDDGRPLEDERD